MLFYPRFVFLRPDRGQQPDISGDTKQLSGVIVTVLGEACDPFTNHVTLKPFSPSGHSRKLQAFGLRLNYNLVTLTVKRRIAAGAQGVFWTPGTDPLPSCPVDGSESLQDLDQHL